MPLPPLPHQPLSTRQSPALRITILYIVFASLWMIFSDIILHSIVHDRKALHLLSQAQNWIFIIATASVLWILLQRLMRQIKHSEAALRADEERARDIFNSVNEAIFIYDPDSGRILDTNITACQMFGYSREDILALPPGALSSGSKPFAPEKIMEILSQVSAGLPIIEEWHAKDRYGHFFWTEINARPAKISGQPRVILTLHDIDQRKQATQELHESRAALRSLLGRIQYTREEERIRIAREVHDVLGQLLTALKMDLSWFQRRLPIIPEEQRPLFYDKLNQANSLADSMLESVQKISRDLRPSLLDNLGLPAAISRETQQFSSRTGIECELEICPDEFSFPPETSSQIFRIFQEILTNVARHAQATRLHVDLSISPENLLVLSVADNGCGVPTKALTAPTSLGILGMIERADLIGASLQIQNLPAGGTLVILSLPLKL